MKQGRKGERPNVQPDEISQTKTEPNTQGTDEIENEK